MPGAVAAAVTIAIIDYTTIAAGTAIFLGAVAGAAAGIAIVVGANTLMGALAKKPKTPNLSSAFGSLAQSRQITVRQPAAPWQVIYGMTRVGGVISFIESANSDKDLRVVVTIAGHEVDAISDPILDGQQTTLNGSGDDGSSKFSNRVHDVQKNLGTSTQAAFSNLVADSSAWTTNHRQRGRAGVYVRLNADSDARSVFPGGMPNITFEVRGKKVYDPRTDATAWSDNAALCLLDYILDSDYGLGATYSTDVDDTLAKAAANVCDEMVNVVQASQTFTADASTDICTLADDTLAWRTGDKVQVSTTTTLPAGLAASTDYYVIVLQRTGASGSNKGDLTKFSLATSLANARAGTAIDITDAGTGTHTVTRHAEPRYTCNGALSLDQSPEDILNALRSAMAGYVFTPEQGGGKWRLYAGEYRTPTQSLDESDLRGPLTFTTLHPRRELFNAVKGVYVSRENEWQPTDFPAVTNSTYETEDDGERIYAELDLPFTSSPSAAQRIGKSELERHRQQITITRMPCLLTAFKVQPPEVVQISNTRMGWSSKVFECVGSRLVIYDAPGGPAFGVDLELRETASTVFSWTSGTDETTVDPAPNTNLPSITPDGRISLPVSVGLISGQTPLTDSGNVKLTVVDTITAVEWAATFDNVLQFEVFVPNNFRFDVENTLTITAQQVGSTDSETIAYYIWGEDGQTNYQAGQTSTISESRADYEISVPANTISSSEKKLILQIFPATNGHENDPVRVYGWTLGP